ncbi:hypothetical protein NQ314_004836 [Rhamnusium bicolor]|uniref:RAD51D N-terminal domain-containing protein n=1 Tax=Rhamnusium bicolor TaxID=1586634 RepID=A0AAV8ZL90_9CUCU|nr:hypothetical protein NQ314_004836 [Rhamnusium bicolor]
MSRLSPNMHTILKSDIIELLNSKQIYTVLDFIKTDSKVIEKTSNLTFREILDIRKVLLNKYSAHPRNALDYFKYTISNSAIIQTGIKKVGSIVPTYIDIFYLKT